MLTASQLAIMREAQENALPTACAIWRAVITVDTTGGLVEGWGSVEANVCRVGKTGKPTELAIAERRGIAEPYTVTLPYDSTVTAGDQVRTLSRVFNVIDVLRGSWDTASRCICEEVK